MFQNGGLGRRRELQSLLREEDAQAAARARVHAANSRSPYEPLPCARGCVTMPAVIPSSRSISDGIRSGSFIVVVDRATLPMAVAI